jgi:putative redox protein
MVRVVARRRSGYTHDVEIEGGHTLVIDEPVERGGADEGPSPTRTLGAALAACTAITAEMYADRKGWDLGDLEVEVEIGYEGPVATSFEVTLCCPGELDDQQLDRLLTIAAKCPVHKALAAHTPVTVVDRVARR